MANLHDARTTLRGMVLQALGLDADTMLKHSSDPNLDKRQHSDVSRDLTYALGGLMGPNNAAVAADLAGTANEGLSGVIEKLSGRDFFSPSGFDMADVEANRQGQQLGVDELAGLAAAKPMPMMDRIGAAIDTPGRLIRKAQQSQSIPQTLSPLASIIFGMKGN